VNISVGVPPPELPVYEQPPIPAMDTFGRRAIGPWSDDDQDYYWVPGTWVLAPQPEYLWTPAIGLGRRRVHWHTGYWGPHVASTAGSITAMATAQRLQAAIGRAADVLQRSVNNISNTNITNVYNKT